MSEFEDMVNNYGKKDEPENKKTLPTRPHAQTTQFKRRPAKREAKAPIIDSNQFDRTTSKKEVVDNSLAMKSLDSNRLAELELNINILTKQLSALTDTFDDQKKKFDELHNHYTITIKDMQEKIDSVASLTKNSLELRLDQLTTVPVISPPSNVAIPPMIQFEEMLRKYQHESDSMEYLYNRIIGNKKDAGIVLRIFDALRLFHDRGEF